MNVEAQQAGAAALACSALSGETAHRFGAGLVGILHRPAQPAGQRVAVILINAGLVHRVGPFRGYVELARVFASQGYPVLRYDVGGLGDSEAARLGSVESRVTELKSAIELLEAQVGAARFVLGGICSGADDGFLLAGLEPRVVGLIMLDGPAHRAPGYWWRHILHKMMAPRELARSLRLRWAGRPPADDYREFPPRDEAIAQLGQLVARDVRLFFLHTAGNSHYINHRSQFFRNFGRVARASQVTMDMWRDCDHTFYLRRDRERLQQTLLAWLQREFAADPSPLAGRSG
ncbi:MAG: alpha/beta hydrolase [Lysobacter sp.]